ncbi:MAG: CAF17-like 4Fe-4S cluster assembly/insertion protein YgfZ, partial [Actinomycetota bacterium]
MRGARSRAPRGCVGYPPRAAGSRWSRAGCEERPRRRYPARAMRPITAPAAELAALSEGRGAVDLSSYRTVRVAGDDARRWLHDLVTTDVASLRTGEARRSLLLDATGHIRADMHVACDDEGFWLFQAPDQPEHVGSALAVYVLSSAVRIDELTGERALVAIPGSSEDGGGFRPSALGTGRDVLIDAGELRAPPGREFVSDDAAEVWRIRAGRPRMGPDFDRSSIPAEAGLESLIDATKGCFLGQESVARVRNLGHPPRLLRQLECDGRVDTGSTLTTTAGDEAGIVTSAADRDGGGTVLLASVRWVAREQLLRSPDGLSLFP